jgi:hypothetical protein
MKHITDRAFSELFKAHVIIQAMFAMLTEVQQIEWIMKADSNGLSSASGNTTREEVRNALFTEFKNTPVMRLDAPARDADLETLVAWSAEAMNQGFDVRLVNMVVRQVIEEAEIPRPPCKVFQFQIGA